MRIASRAEWGARHRDGFGPAPIPADQVWLHHSAGPALNGAGIIRDLEAVGQRRFGGGMSYTFAITPDGSVYEGHSVGREGAHTIGRNTKGRGICLVGNYEVITPSSAMIDALVWLLRHGHASGWWKASRLNGGHRDVTQTACPGRHAYALIPEINRRAGQPEEDDMNDAQNAALIDIRAQLVGTTELGKYPGWDTDDGKLTVVDMLRGLISRQRTIEDKLDALKTALPSMVAEEVRTALADGLVDVDVTVQDCTTPKES